MKVTKEPGPDCGKVVRWRGRCRFCGYNFRASFTDQQSRAERRARQEGFQAGIALTWLFVGGIGAFVGLFAVLFGADLDELPGNVLNALGGIRLASGVSAIGAGIVVLLGMGVIWFVSRVFGFDPTERPCLQRCGSKVITTRFGDDPFCSVECRRKYREEALRQFGRREWPGPWAVPAVIGGVLAYLIGGVGYGVVASPFWGFVLVMVQIGGFLAVIIGLGSMIFNGTLLPDILVPLLRYLRSREPRRSA